MGMTNRVKRAIIVGIGAHAHSWRKVLKLHEDWELAAVVDTDTEKLEHASKIWGVEEDEAYTNLEEAFQFGDGPYDLAIIATPIYTHHVLCLEALDLGLNVICEKNLCSTIDQGRQMVKAAAAHPELCTATGTQTRYFPKNWTLKKYYLEHKDQVGPITSVNFECLYNHGKTRFGWRRWLPDIFMEDMAPHHFDYLRYLTDMDVVQVQGGINFKPSFSQFRGSSTTFAIFALAKPEDYDDKDKWVYATYRGDWQKRGENYSKFALNCEHAELTLLENNGPKVIASLFDDDVGTTYHNEDVPLTSDIEYNEDEYTDQIYILEQMSKGIDSKGKLQPKTCFADAFKSFAVSRGIVEATKTGNAVYLPKYWKNLPGF